MSTTCPSPKVLEQFVAATLSEAEADELLVHLDSCEVCDARLRELEQSIPENVVAGFRKLQSKTLSSHSALPERIGKYEILEKIGEGGMGTVYRAWHPGFQRDIAVKVLKTTRLGDPNSQRRFEQEIKTAGQLQHENIVRATDAHIGESDESFIVMELLDGSDLGEYVRNRGPVSVTDALDWIRQAAKGLGHAHQAGFVHRDVKPSNLFLTHDGIVKLLDLGLVRSVSVATPSRHTETGHVVGSPSFMAPEQLRGETVDPRSDIYSLGCTLVYILTGKSLSESHNKLPITARSLVTKMIAGMPEQRFQSMSEVVAAIDTELRRSRVINTISHPAPILIGIIALVLFSFIVAMLVTCNETHHPDRMSANDFGLQAVTGLEKSPLPTVAVFEFDANTPDESLHIWRKGMRDMLATDMAQGKRLQVVERSRLHDILAEHHLTDTQFIDQTTAVGLGKGLAAHWIVVGSFLTLGNNMRIDARIVSVERGTVVAAESVSGKKDDMLELEKHLAEKLLLAVDSSPEIPVLEALRQPHTSNVEAFTLYSHAMAAKDMGDIQAARHLLAQVVALDKNFLLAIRELNSVESNDK